jgi:hypothetical protein
MAPPTSPQRPPLLRLPAELRSTIYQYVFRDSRINIYPLSTTPRRSGSRLDNPWYYCNRSLLLVSKEILAEAAPELYRSTRLIVHGLDTAQCLTSLVPAHFLARIKHVHLPNVDSVFSAPLAVGTPPTLLFDPDALPALEAVSISTPIFKRLYVSGNHNQQHEVSDRTFTIDDSIVTRVPNRLREISDKAIIGIVHEYLSHPAGQPARYSAFQHAVQQLRDKAPRSYKVICRYAIGSPYWPRERSILVSSSK